MNAPSSLTLGLSTRYLSQVNAASLKRERLVNLTYICVKHYLEPYTKSIKRLKPQSLVYFFIHVHIDACSNTRCVLEVGDV